MKYLKFFKEALESNEFYQQITYEEYKELSTIEPFEVKEIDIIKDCLNDNRSTPIHIDLNKDEDDVYEISVTVYKNATRYMHSSILIHKLEDDYFILRDSPNSMSNVEYFYKVDQLEGLIKLLKQIALYNF